VDGARTVRGLPGFTRNAVPALSGGYASLPSTAAEGTTAQGSDGSGEALRIAVWFTRERLVFPVDWNATAGGPFSCRTLPAGVSARASLAEADGSSLWALGTDGSTLFLRMPGGFADANRFATVFTERFLFFQRYAERSEDTSFPAILDLGR